MLRTLNHLALKRFSITSMIRYRFAEESKEPELTSENAQQIIDKMVKSNKICLFMKGTP